MDEEQLKKEIKEKVDPQALRALRNLLESIEAADALPEHAMRKVAEDVYVGELSDGRHIGVRHLYDPHNPEHVNPEYWLDRLAEVPKGYIQIEQ